MSLQPTGRLDCSSAIPELIYERRLPVARSVAWAALTESERCARWIGSWTGDAGAGKSVDLVWLAEEGAPTETIKILACDPPRRLALAGGPDPSAPWLVTIELYEDGEATRIEFRQQMSNGLSPALVGTGWEFYLDRYAGAIAGDVELPLWDDRYQQLQPHYEELQAAMSLCEE